MKMADDKPPYVEPRGQASGSVSDETPVPPQLTCAEPEVISTGGKTEPSMDKEKKGITASEDNTTPSHSACPLEEHETLQHLLSVLPLKAMKGLFSVDVNYTDMDVSKEFIALITDVGLIFLYDRLSQNLQKLKSPIRGEHLTAIKMQQSIDYVVAVGSIQGLVYVFQLPSILPGRAKQLQMYRVEELHVGAITALEWSPNTGKLFSGDTDGNVICTEFDYENNQSKSFTVCQEPHPIIQLSYAHKTLLVSTTFRSVLWSSTNAVEKVKKIGTKDKKVLGDFGACFMPGSYKPGDAVLYVSRPGLRLWRADIQGTVLMTYMYRDLLRGKTNFISVLPDTLTKRPTGAIEEINLGPLFAFNSQFLVTWAKGTLMVLDPSQGKLIGMVNNIGDIISVSVGVDEIYVLRRNSDRFVLRIATKKDPLNEMERSSSEASTPSKQRLGTSAGIPNSPVHLLQHTAGMMSSGLKAALQGVTDRIQEGQQVAVSSTPPWGYASGGNQKSLDDQDVDSCKEVSSASSMASSVDLGSPVHALPAKDEAQGGDKNQPGATSGSAHPPDGGTSAEPSTSKSIISARPKLQPEIHLESDDVISVHIPEDVPDLPMSEGATESLTFSKVTSEQTISERRNNILERLTNIPAEGNDDIVYSPKPKKHKKKKLKSGTSNVISEDNLSVDSLELASTGSVGSNQDMPYKQRSSSVSPSLVKLELEQTRDEADSETATGNTEEAVYKNDGINALKLDEPSPSDPSLSPDSLQTQEYQPSEDSSLPPIQDLSDEFETKLITTPEVSRTGSNRRRTDETAAERPKDLPPLTATSTPSIIPNNDQAPPFRRASSPLNFVPLKPERSTSVPSPPELETSLTSASSISASYHEDMNQASFETYARQNSERSMADTPSPPSETRRSLYQTSDSSDDFYSKYQKNASLYSIDDIYSPSAGPSIEDALEYGNASDTRLQEYSSMDTASLDSSRSKTIDLAKTETDAMDIMYQFSDTWTEMLAPGNLQSMCVTDRHIWVVDKSDRLHYSSLNGPGLTWRKVDEAARQIAVSRSGSIVWRLHQGSVYAGTKITARSPAGLNWVEVLRKEVVFIAVDDSTAWYIKNNGDVMMQKGLSRDRPSFRSIKVPSGKIALKQVICRNGVVWGVTASQTLFVRKGITGSREEGTLWEPLEMNAENLVISSCALGDDGTAWIIDPTCRVWFTTDVTSDNPVGSGKWWEVAISEYVTGSDSAMALAMKPLAEFPLTKLVVPAGEKGGLITVGKSGIWVSQGYRHVLNICRGSLLGHRWEVAGPSGMASSAKWILVSSCAAIKTDGLIWAQQPNGAIFVFSPSLTGKVIEVSPPRPEMEPFRCISAYTDSMWALTNMGQVVVRSGMASHCPHGLSWVMLDLVQLGNVKLVHLTCGTQNIWAVDNTGMVYQRIGNQPPNTAHLNPAWVPVEGETHTPGTKFTKVYTGASDWMVWAIDSKKGVYARVGVTDSMPIGTHWLYVPGILSEDLSISERLVYTLNQSGELLVRYGILEENPAGDYWKKIPGKFTSISVTSTDNLWGINHQGQLCLRTTNFLLKKDTGPAYSPTRVNVSISDDWEVI